MVKKLRYEDVQASFLARGDTLLTKIYVNNATRMPYKCGGCGGSASITWNHYHNEQRSGCKACNTKRRGDTMETRYGARNPAQVPAFRQQAQDTMETRYGGRTSFQCSALLQQAQDTMETRYGARYSGQIPAFRQKAQDTMQTRYGARHPWQVPAFLQQAQDTMETRYGARNAAQVPAFLQQAQDTMETRYGARNAAQVPAFRQQAQDTMETRYGGRTTFECPALLQQAQDTMQTRYGARNPSQVPELLARQQASAFSTKTHLFDDGAQIEYQGYELHALLYLLATGVSQEEIVRGHQLRLELSIWYTFDDKRHRYHPDIFLPTVFKIIEVKSRWTYEKDKSKNHAKMLQCQQDGFVTELWIIGAKGKIEEVLLEF